MNFLKNISKKEKITIIMTLRDLLASIGSTCYKWSKFRSDALDAQTLYLNIVGHIKQIFRLKKLGKKIQTLIFQTLECLTILGIELEIANVILRKDKTRILCNAFFSNCHFIEYFNRHPYINFY